MQKPDRISPDRLESFIQLGLTPLEAEVYAYLCAEREPVTAYRAAQALGKSVGNVYKAVEALEAKGAAMSADAGGSRVTRGVAIDEWLGQRRSEFERAAAEARKAAANWGAPAWDERVYEIPTLDALLARADAALATAQQFVICTLCPRPAALLSEGLLAARRRGVRVGAKVFEPLALEGCDIVCDPRGLAAVVTGPGEWLFMTVDGTSLLLALLDPAGERVLQAFWSENPLMVWNLYTGMSSDLVLAAIRPLIAADAGREAIEKRQAELRVFESPVSGGKNALIERYRAGIRPRRKPG